MSHLLLELFSKVWAMRAEALADAISLVSREDVTPEMLASSFHFSEQAQEEALVGGTNRYAVHQRASTRVDGTSGLYRRGATAILPITGPIVRRGGMSLSSGPITSVEVMARDFTRAVEDDAFAAILLDVDTPGGEASGIDEFARMIYDARGVKPITAYVSDLGASAGYWLASAADELILAPSAAVGSIGCVMAVRDPKATRQTAIEFVSSMSPNKRPDPHTKEGKGELQSLVDSLGQLFVEAVAKHRGVTADVVERDFGAGGLKVGQAAVDSGMADRLGSLEGTLRELAEQTKPQPRAARAPAAALPATEPVPEAPAPATASSPAATAPIQGTGETPMDILTGLRALVDQYSGDQAASLAAQHLTDPAPQAPAPAAQAAPAATPQVLGDTTAGDEIATLRRRAIAAEAENSRLRIERINERASAFAKGAQDDLRALAPEAPHLINLYSLLAQDDELHGPVALGGGKTATRVSFLETFIAARPTRKDLTDDVMGSTMAHVLNDRARPKADPNGEPDTERLAQLMAHTSTGRDVLSAIAKSGGAPAASR